MFCIRSVSQSQLFTGLTGVTTAELRLNHTLVKVVLQSSAFTSCAVSGSLIQVQVQAERNYR